MGAEQTSVQSCHGWVAVWTLSQGHFHCDGIVVPYSKLVCNLGVLMDSQLLLKEQMAAVTRRAFAQLHFVPQLLPFLDQEALPTVTDHLKTGLFQCTLNGAALLNNSEATADTKCNCMNSHGHLLMSPYVRTATWASLVANQFLGATQSSGHYL